MSQGFFREEVLEARRATWLGHISVIQPPSIWLLTISAVIFGAAVLLFLAFGTYMRRSTVTGRLVPIYGLSEVLAPATGIVERMRVAEGECVHQGQELAIILVPRATPMSGNVQQLLSKYLDNRQAGLIAEQQAQEQQIKVRTRGIEIQIAVARRELGQIEMEVATKRNQERITQETLNRFNQLKGTQYVSVLQIKQQAAAVLEYAGQAQALQQQAIDMRRTIAQLEEQEGEFPVQKQSIDASLQRDLAQLGQDRLQAEMQGAFQIKAPVDGVIATQMAKVGQAVQAGEPLLSVLPKDGRLEAELLVPSRAIGFVKPGDRVLLRYRAYPYERFGHHFGRVTRVSRTALSGGELGVLVGNVNQGEPFYRVTVKLAQQSVLVYGRPEVLRSGMLVDADILGEKRRLIEWILDPLYSIRGV